MDGFDVVSAVQASGGVGLLIVAIVIARKASSADPTDEAKVKRMVVLFLLLGGMLLSFGVFGLTRP
ncbi:hypothetical protein [Arthrobacter sp. N1]|uniref:hypothetical protein n=1 Tax=Arthrobacter sp. N1 TaxID=619291 RepID=UPI003BB13831